METKEEAKPFLAGELQACAVTANPLVLEQQEETLKLAGEIVGTGNDRECCSGYCSKLTSSPPGSDLELSQAAKPGRESKSHLKALFSLQTILPGGPLIRAVINSSVIRGELSTQHPAVIKIIT